MSLRAERGNPHTVAVLYVCETSVCHRERSEAIYGDCFVTLLLPMTEGLLAMTDGKGLLAMSGRDRNDI